MKRAFGVLIAAVSVITGTTMGPGEVGGAMWMCSPLGVPSTLAYCNVRHSWFAASLMVM